jgi:hypothetical protein
MKLIMLNHPCYSILYQLFKHFISKLLNYYISNHPCFLYRFQTTLAIQFYINLNIKLLINYYKILNKKKGVAGPPFSRAVAESRTAGVRQTGVFSAHVGADHGCWGGCECQMRSLGYFWAFYLGFLEALGAFLAFHMLSICISHVFHMLSIRICIYKTYKYQ